MGGPDRPPKPPPRGSLPPVARPPAPLWPAPPKPPAPRGAPPPPAPPRAGPSAHAAGDSATPRGGTGEDRMIEVVGVPQRPSVSITASRWTTDVVTARST